MSNNDHDPTDPSEGRVEVFYDGEWGTICSHQWNQADANVFCRQLGFKEAVQPYIDATHGEGSGPIWLDHLVCSGNFPPMFLDLAIYCSSFYYTEI